MEADLARYYHVDYRDRWREPRLTLRRIGVMVAHLPLDASCSILLNDEKLPWTRTEHLLDDLRRTVEATAGQKNPKPHPDRKTKPHVDKDRVRKLQAARARAHERRRKIAAGLIT